MTTVTGTTVMIGEMTEEATSGGTTAVGMEEAIIGGMTAGMTAVMTIAERIEGTTGGKSAEMTEGGITEKGTEGTEIGNARPVVAPETVLPVVCHSC